MGSKVTRILAIKIELQPEHINTLSEVLNEAVSQIDLNAPSCVLSLIVEQHPADGGSMSLVVVEGSIVEGGKTVAEGNAKISRCKFDGSLEYTEK